MEQVSIAAALPLQDIPKHSRSTFVPDPLSVHRVKWNCFLCLSKSHTYATNLCNFNEYMNIKKRIPARF